MDVRDWKAVSLGLIAIASSAISVASRDLQASLIAFIALMAASIGMLYDKAALTRTAGFALYILLAYQLYRSPGDVAFCLAVAPYLIGITEISCTVSQVSRASKVRDASGHSSRYLAKVIKESFKQLVMLYMFTAAAFSLASLGIFSVEWRRAVALTGTLLVLAMAAYSTRGKIIFELRRIIFRKYGESRNG